ncbi:MAG: sugar phosphate isomerase/epimerase family protein [bacterium]|jgi:sugar phosphate isomerase/epimerase|nr:sugar phosphate isomerase/epimerase family protein [bacterium]
MLDRREFIEIAGVGLVAAGILTNAGHAAEGVPVGICDWNLRDANNHGGTCRPDLIPRAKEAHLDGIQVSIGSSPDNIPLRSAEVRKQYVELGKQHGIAFPSVAAGSICNSIPLKSEPQSAIYVLDALEGAKALGAKCTLIAFFGNGDLRLADSTGKLRNISKEQYKEYELDSQGVSRVVEALRQLVPRAEDLGVIIGLENTLTAKQNLEIIERVGSPMVQVYYDIANSFSNGYDVPGEIRMLGNERICEIHLKDNGKDVTYFEAPNADIDWPAITQAVKDIGFDKWFVIEESGRENRFMEDTQASVAFAKKVLA